MSLFTHLCRVKNTSLRNLSNAHFFVLTNEEADDKINNIIITKYRSLL